MYKIEIYDDHANNILCRTIEKALTFDIMITGDQILLNYLQPCGQGLTPMFTAKEFIITKDGKVFFQNLKS